MYKNPLRILLASIRIFLLLVVMAMCLFPYLLLSAFVIQNTPEKAFKLRRWYLVFLNFILGIKVKVEGEIPDFTALFVSNHRSFSDPLVLLKYIDAYVIAKAEVADMPMIHSAANLTGIIYVQRNDKNSRTAVRQALIDTIKKGLNVLVYPEGTTNPYKKLIEYRPGTFMEAAQHNIPVVPVILEYKNAKDVWFNRSLVSQFFRQFGHFRTHVKLSFGPAFNDAEGLVLRDKIQTWSQQKVDSLHDGWDSVFEHAEEAI